MPKRVIVPEPAADKPRPGWERQPSNNPLARGRFVLELDRGIRLEMLVDIDGRWWPCIYAAAGTGGAFNSAAAAEGGLWRDAEHLLKRLTEALARERPLLSEALK